MVQEMKKLAMVQLDVFTSRALTGNARAVCRDGRGLSREQMQALARETNLSETTFILHGDPAAEKERGIRVRIFTVKQELPFAGHPTLGTAYVLHQQSGAPEVRLELNVGTVPVRFERTDGQPVFGEMTQKNPEFLEQHPVDAIAPFTNLSAADFDDSVPIQTVSTGLPYTIAAVRSLGKPRGLHVDAFRAQKYLAKSGGAVSYFLSGRNARAKSSRHRGLVFF